MPQNKLVYLTTTSVGFLIVGIAIVSFKLYDFSVKNKQLKDRLTLEKSLHHNQISEILHRYDSVKEFRTAVLLEEKQNNNTVIAEVNEDKAVVKPTLVSKKSSKPSPVVTLKAVNLNARGVRLVSNDVVETNISSKIDQVRICFTLEENKNIEEGSKQLFVQVLNPKGRLLVLKNPSENKLSKAVYYGGINTDACMFVELYQHQLIVGDYKINLIHNGKTIGTTNFRVN